VYYVAHLFLRSFWIGNIENHPKFKTECLTGAIFIVASDPINYNLNYDGALILIAFLETISAIL